MFTISRRNLITATVLTAVTSPAWAKTQTINTDIVIIGGGLGGTFRREHCREAWSPCRGA